MYEYDEQEILKEIKKNKPKTVMLQMPEGLRENVAGLVKKIEALKIKCYVWAGSCYGACDLPSFKTDLLIHFGHARFVK